MAELMIGQRLAVRNDPAVEAASQRVARAQTYRDRALGKCERYGAGALECHEAAQELTAARADLAEKQQRAAAGK